ncbi:Clp protease ATPase [Caballeronia arationis]|jgi:type VI secretion system protein VasG|uniref:Type VI secretion system protein VasG n=1 Tax=Caballeronia arationis TaxID=1777142 RepID=A0A7Z7IEL8_9BURK|nr:type VI secretion system ATPase TssH [Caballeronia arationis]SAK86202.1 Clp protease ATPase [Caballeronia arationis]SOE89510.1 type VI secretion system protein VasG [Caballeronia arationis]
MTEISRLALFGKLDAFAYRAIESGTVFCKLRGNPYVELAHWLHQILLAQDCDLQRIVRHFELDHAVLARDLTAALDRLPRGSMSVSDISAQVDEAVERGWVFGSLMFNAAKVRTGHLVIGILRTPNLRNALFAISRQFEKISLDALSERFDALLAGSPEGSAEHTQHDRHAGPQTDPLGGQDALERYTVDLTAEARSGKLDPIVGRDDEIRQVIDILMRRRQNNPILTGEAGVGKTAVVEGFAQRLVAGEVPPSLRDAVVRTLDVGLLQAGASMKGEFEQRLKQVIEQVQASEKPVILFIDEAHTLVGAGGAAGTGDAANLLKPALARGTLRTIAATTWVEYKKHIEKDPALTRRFQVVQVPEPSEACAVTMLRGLALGMQQHHGVQVLDEALEAAVALSHRYIPARQLPDKAVSLLDTACARVAVSQHALPPALDDARRRIDAWQTEAQIVAREAALGIDTAARAADVAARLDSERARLAELSTRHEAERALVARILALQSELEASDGTDAARLAELQALQQELAQRQGETPLILPAVDRQAVASVVQDWTGIPVGRMMRDDIANVLDLAATLNRRVVGQQHAMQMIARRVQTSRAGLDNPEKPVGVFMLAGTSGVGKTETALALAEALYGGEQNVITVNMSEYQEAHTVSSLKGAPPGYVGYGEGGVLTEAVRRRPYSVVLLDEFEKAHPDVHELFFQVFDKGRMEDGDGRQIDFRHTLILLTTNVGTELVTRLCGDARETPAPEVIARALRAPLVEVFPPALLGRVVVIPYYPLDDTMLDAVIRLQLARIERRIAERHRVTFAYDDAMVRQIASRCTEFESGGRMIDAILTNTLLPRISAEFLARLMEGREVAKVEVSARDGEFTYAFD